MLTTPVQSLHMEGCLQFINIPINQKQIYLFIYWSIYLLIYWFIDLLIYWFYFIIYFLFKFFFLFFFVFFITDIWHELPAL